MPNIPIQTINTSSSVAAVTKAGLRRSRLGLEQLDFISRISFVTTDLPQVARLTRRKCLYKAYAN